MDADVLCVQETGDALMQPDTDVRFDVALAASLERCANESGFEVEPRSLNSMPAGNGPEHQPGDEIEVDGDLCVASAVAPDPH